MKNNTLSKLPYKGTTDWYPEDMFFRNYIFNIWTKVAHKYGYEEYDTPLVEDANLYRVKSGDDIANNQLYSFVDKGGREIAIKPEMTPSLARIIAAKRDSLVKPLRWFNIGRYYRYEKPQKGRRREFFQLNIDILGETSLNAEVEIIQFVMDVMSEFKASKDTYELRLNNRYLLDYLFDDLLNLNDDLKPKVGRALDNYLKMSSSDFKEYLKELTLTKEQVSLVLEYLKWDITDLKKIKNKSRGAKEILEIFNQLKLLNISNVVFSPSVVRGLLYYTGTVIELFDIGDMKNPRALFGGGRYDDLLEIFGQEKLPAFGLGWGDTTTLDYLRSYNLLPQYKRDVKVFVTLLDERYIKDLNDITKELRKKGVNTLKQLSLTKLSTQLKYASSMGIPWVVILGEEEQSKGVVQLKDMESRKSFIIKKEDLISKIFTKA